jgi:DinB superfamily
MTFKDSISQLIAGIFLENPAKGKSFAQLRSALELSGTKMLARLEVGKPNPELLRHIITIERWGQHRLRSTLGEVQFVLDRSGQYAPASTLGWDELKSEFAKVRQETLEITRRLELANPAPGPVVHNQFGPVSVKGWLRYLNVHANMEVQRKLRS